MFVWQIQLLIVSFKQEDASIVLKMFSSVDIQNGTCTSAPQSELQLLQIPLILIYSSFSKRLGGEMVPKKERKAECFRYTWESVGEDEFCAADPEVPEAVRTDLLTRLKSLRRVLSVD